MVPVCIIRLGLFEEPDRPWKCVPKLLMFHIGVPRILQWTGFTWWGQARGLGDFRPPVGSRGKAPVGDLGDEVPQKLKQNVKLAYNF